MFLLHYEIVNSNYFFMKLIKIAPEKRRHWGEIMHIFIQPCGLQEGGVFPWIMQCTVLFRRQRRRVENGVHPVNACGYFASRFHTWRIRGGKCEETIVQSSDNNIEQSSKVKNE